MGQASWPKSSRKGIGVYTPHEGSYVFAEGFRLSAKKADPVVPIEYVFNFFRACLCNSAL